jgi:hypothetical protein
LTTTAVLVCLPIQDRGPSHVSDNDPEPSLAVVGSSLAWQATDG